MHVNRKLGLLTFLGLCWSLLVSKTIRWTFFLCKHLLLLQKMLIAAGHVSENSLRHIPTDSTGISAKGRGGGDHFPSSHTWLRPCLHVSLFVWERNFFSPFSKKFASTRSFFDSFSPVHTYVMNQFENDNLPQLCKLDSYVYAYYEPEKVAFSNENGYVWTRPELTSLRKRCVSFNLLNHKDQNLNSHLLPYTLTTEVVGRSW